MLQVASVTATDGGSGIAPVTFSLAVTSNELLANGEVIVQGSTVVLRAARSGFGEGRTYVVAAAVSDLAGNTAEASATCTIPHDQSN